MEKSERHIQMELSKILTDNDYAIDNFKNKYYDQLHFNS